MRYHDKISDTSLFVVCWFHCQRMCIAITVKITRGIMQTKVDPDWLSYQPKIITYLQSLPLDTFINESHAEIALLSIENIELSKEAFNILKEHITSKALDSIRVRYRSHKYRQSHDKKTVVMSDSAKQKLRDFMASIDAQSVDEALDYLLSEKYTEDTKEAIKKHSDTLYGDEIASAKGLKKRLTERDKVIFDTQIANAFDSGWRSAKTSRSKKRNAKALANEKYLNNIQQ